LKTLFTLHDESMISLGCEKERKYPQALSPRSCYLEDGYEIIAIFDQYIASSRTGYKIYNGRRIETRICDLSNGAIFNDLE